MSCISLRGQLASLCKYVPHCSQLVVAALVADHTYRFRINYEKFHLKLAPNHKVVKQVVVGEAKSKTKQSLFLLRTYKPSEILMIEKVEALQH